MRNKEKILKQNSLSSRINIKIGLALVLVTKAGVGTATYANYPENAI